MTKRAKTRLIGVTIAGLASLSGWAGGHYSGRPTAASVNTPNIACLAVSEVRLGVCVG